MDDRIVKLPVMLSKNSGRTYAQRWQARMTPDEALTAVHRMMAAYSEFSPCRPEYLMTIAETLCQFPMEVATAACSPVHGVPKEHKNFRPNSGQITEWCEREAAWLYRMAEREGLLRADSHKTYTGTLVTHNQKDNPKETRPTLAEVLDRAAKIMGREVKDGHLTADAATVAAEEEQAAKRGAIIDKCNEKLQADWQTYASVSEGIKISPSLRKNLADYAHAAQPFEAPELTPVPF